MDLDRNVETATTRGCGGGDTSTTRSNPAAPARLVTQYAPADTPAGLRCTPMWVARPKKKGRWRLK
jgi:hypothetical protein